MAQKRFATLPGASIGNILSSDLERMIQCTEYSQLFALMLPRFLGKWKASQKSMKMTNLKESK
jgi:hypothetical protein